MKKILLGIVFLGSFLTIKAQNQICNLQKSEFSEIYTVNKNEAICLAINSEKEKTLFFSFGIWCGPCIKHLPNAIKLADENNLDFYVILIDKEESRRAYDAIKYLQDIKRDIKILILKDDIAKRPRKKYKIFLTEITPPEFENIPGMSKYIIIDNKGEVLMVTNYKDNIENDLRDDSKIIENRIIPILN